MRRGTKSLLFGCHQVLLHPWYVLRGWGHVYGWGWKNGPWRWHLLLAMVIHDWGYWGCREMDGEDGMRHPERIANWVAGKPAMMVPRFYLLRHRLYKAVLLHSRWYAREVGEKPHRLCWADKAAAALMPSWLWAILAHLSGEGYEYMDLLRYEIHGDGEQHTIRNLIGFHGRLRKWFGEQVLNGVVYDTYEEGE